MPQVIKMFKLVTGEVVIGKYNEKNKEISEVAILQGVQTPEGMQMALVPYGYPFEVDFVADLKEEFAIYEYKKVAEEIETRYLEACSKLTLSTNKSGIITK